MKNYRSVFLDLRLWARPAKTHGFQFFIRNREIRCCLFLMASGLSDPWGRIKIPDLPFALRHQGFGAELDAVPAAFLGLIHGEIGVSQKAGQAVPVDGGDGGPDTDPESPHG